MKGDYAEFKSRLKAVELNQTSFSVLVGLEKQSVSRWNLSGVPKWANLVVELLEKNKVLEERLKNNERL